MRNVLSIFREDLRHLLMNTVAAIVTIGLIIVPPMYAWLTTLGFWNPYGNTGGLEVAVANEDAGYASALFPSRIEVGNSIMAKLHENDQFHWVFVSAEEAEAGVRSGAYYAGIVIPEGFSADLMSVLSTQEKTPELIYYVNQKENAIASHVTATGTSVLQTQIDRSFARTVADVALSVMHDLTDFMDGDGLENYGGALLAQVEDASAALEACLTEAHGIQGVLSITGELLSSSTRILEGASALKEPADALGADASSSLESAGSALQDASSALAGGLESAQSSIGSIQDAVDDAFASASSDPTYAHQLISDAVASVSDLRATYEDARNELASLGASTDVLTALDGAISSLDALSSELSSAQGALSALSANASAAQADVSQKIATARAEMQSVDTTLSQAVATQIRTLSQTLTELNASAGELSDATAAAAEAASGATSGLAQDLTEVQDSLAQAIGILTSAKESLDASADQLRAALASGDMEQVRQILGNDPESLASFIAAPTDLVRHAVYEVPTNGDSMSPFYSSLALWVGAIFSIALANVNVSKKQVATLKEPRAWELYLGRYGVFLVICTLQALVLFIGNVFFLQIHCEHPVAYLGTLLLCALVFSNVVYTLNISFGNIGKAIAIILLVMQLAGTGGIMPIQTSAPFFQAVYPWLPFTHAISALASCMAGIYELQLAQSLLCLAAFLVPSLVLGLALRNPMIRANAFIQEKLDETKFV